MNGAKYKQSLDDNLLHSVNDLQQDNDPEHRANETLKWLQIKNVKVLEWPHSSDLNPIENLWKDLKTAVDRRSPSNLTELEKICKEEWEKITKSRCAKLIQTTQSSNQSYRCFYKVLTQGCEYVNEIFLYFTFNTFAKMSKNTFKFCHDGLLCLDG
jgi:hypothetical protein